MQMKRKERSMKNEEAQGMKAGWQEEEAYLEDTLKVVKRNVASYEAQTTQMQAEIKEMLDHYHDNDVELYTALNNTITMQESMKRALLRNKKALKKPYFGRIDFLDEKLGKEEMLYIGRGGIARDTTHQVVIDWRAPVATAYYENGRGKCSYPAPDGGSFAIDLKKKRTYEIADGRLLDFFDSEVIANDDLLTKYLAKNKQAVLGEIIATIQKEQNDIIRKSPFHNMIVQGVAGSGKTTVAMHRISYILYNYQERFKPDDFYIVGSNRILLEYITGVLPDLDVYGIRQMTMEQLFVRLLYEDWDEKKHKIKMQAGTVADGSIRGGLSWFRDLVAFCERLEDETVFQKSIYLNPRQFVEGFKNGKTGIFDETVGKSVNPADLIEIVAGKDVKDYLRQNPAMSIQSKINMLNERLVVKLQDEFLKSPTKYTKEEKKAILRAYRGRYGKNEWKTSIFDLYTQFLTEQFEKGYAVEIPGVEFDVYDLAALAYLYKRVKETEIISEAHHVVIDEAQDFGMMAYSVLDFCIKDCTYTIMGDVSQNIWFGYGLNDWEELKTLMLSGERAYFGVLKKSYRNTVEISGFAMNILRHGSFTPYAAEPIIRHGNPVSVEECRGRKDMIKKAADLCKSWQEQGLDTIAVICRDEKSAAKTAKDLSNFIPVAESDLEKAVFANGVMVLPVAYTKGLEFDAVLILDPDTNDYPLDDGHAKLLYVAATRALHELCVLHTGNLTELITTPVKDREEVAEDAVENTVEEAEEAREAKEAADEEGADAPAAQTSDTQAPVPEFPVPQPITPLKRVKAVATLKPAATTINTASGRAVPPKTVLLTGVQKGQREKISIKTPLSSTEKILACKPDSREADTRRAQRRSGGVLRQEDAPKFGDMPPTEALNPGGHAKIDLGIKWTYKQADGLYLQSRYGMLRLSPVTSEIIRVTFDGNGQPKEEPHAGIGLDQTEKYWMYKDMPLTVELSTDDLILQVDKKTGAVTYMNDKKKVLLVEKSEPARRVGATASGKGKAWAFFKWKKDLLSGLGGNGQEELKLNGKAYYLSGETEVSGEAENSGKAKAKPSVVLSDKGYALVMPGKNVICCDIPTYGSYLAAEEEQLDFYFVAGKNQRAVLDNINKLLK